MTTGTETLVDFFTTPIPNYGNMAYGRRVIKSWSGPDSVSALKPRKTLPDAKVWSPPPSRERVVIGTRTVHYGGRDHFEKVLSTKLPWIATKGREKKERGLVYNPLTKLWQMRPVEEHKALRAEWLAKYRLKKSLKPNAYTMSKTDIQQSIWLVREGNYMNTVSYGDALWPTLVFDVSQEYRLIDKLRRKVYGSGFNPGIFFGEAPKSLSMIGTAAIRLGASLHAFKKGDWRGMFDAFGVRPNRTHERLLTDQTKFGLKGWRGYNGQDPGDARKRVSRLWLEVQYGWGPLLSDLEAGAAWLAYANNPPIDSGATVRGNRGWEVTHWANSPNLGSLNFRKRVVAYKLQLIIRAVRKTPSINAPSLPTVLGTAWELVPYSFVMDWALPIGAYLQALRTASDLKGTVIRTLQVEKFYSDLAPGGNGGYHPIKRVAGIGDSARVYTLNRTVSEEIVVPSPFSGLVDGHDVLTSSWQRATNAVALITKGDFGRLWDRFQEFRKK